MVEIKSLNPHTVTYHKALGWGTRLCPMVKPGVTSNISAASVEFQYHCYSYINHPHSFRFLIILRVTLRLHSYSFRNNLFCIKVYDFCLWLTCILFKKMNQVILTVIRVRQIITVQWMWMLKSKVKIRCDL